MISNCKKKSNKTINWRCAGCQFLESSSLANQRIDMPVSSLFNDGMIQSDKKKVFFFD
jgi:hypothetical protein